MKTIFDVICKLDTLESFLIVIRNTLMTQDQNQGLVGAQAWEDVFTDLCDKLQDAKEALDSIRKEQNA